MFLAHNHIHRHHHHHHYNHNQRHHLHHRPHVTNMRSDNVGNIHIHVIASRAGPDILRRAFTQLPSCYCPKQIQRDQLDANDCPDMTGSCGLSTRIICATYIIEQVVVVWSNVDIIIVTANPTAGPHPSIHWHSIICPI